MDFLLVHGTTQSHTGWEPLASALSSRGHRVVALDLPVDQPSYCADDYAALAATQTQSLTDPVVVAHSASGLLLPALSPVVGAGHLVWLAAVVPDWFRGRSFAEEIQTAGEHIFFQDWRTLDTPATADPVLATHFLFHDCDLPTLRWALTTVRLFYPKCVYQELPTAAKPAVPSTYVLPRGERVLTPDWMRQAARGRLGVEPIEVDGGHCPHVSQPEVIARILERV